jgi:hypothetical protein
LREESPLKARFNVSAKRLNHFGSSLLKGLIVGDVGQIKERGSFRCSWGGTIISSRLAILFVTTAGPWRRRD